MKLIILTMIAAAILLGIRVNNSFSCQKQESDRELSSKDVLPLKWQLQLLGMKYDYFFTVENTSEEGEPMNSLEIQRVQRLPEAENLSQELERLRQTVSNFAYEVDKAIPKIVHIVDTRLEHKNHYALRDTIKRVDFKRLVIELPAELSKQGIAFTPTQGFSTHEQPDFTTKVEVKGEGISVRDALTNFISLKGRGSRIIWSARTKLAEGGLTRIYYPYPGDQMQK